MATKDLELIEVQMGVCEEKDIIRYEDDFGRAWYKMIDSFYHYKAGWRSSNSLRS